MPASLALFLSYLPELFIRNEFADAIIDNQLKKKKKLFSKIRMSFKISILTPSNFRFLSPFFFSDPASYLSDQLVGNVMVALQSNCLGGCRNWQVETPQNDRFA